MRALLVCAAFVCACSDGSGTSPDAATGDGNVISDGAGCMRPALDQPWLRGLVSDVVTSLATAPRATLTQRNAARTYLGNQLTMIGWTSQLHNYSTGSNLFATLPSTTGATRQIIVGAHFDTVAGSPGANDNATGVAAVLAVARYVRDMTCRSAAVTIVMFDEEEVGLVGARAYAAMLGSTQITAVHTVDQIGWDNDNDSRFELEAPSTALEAEYRAAAMIVGVPVAKTSTQGTDHEAFRDRGYAAIGLTEEYVGGDTSPHRHTAQDTAATVDSDYLVLGTKLVAQVVMTELQ